MPAPADEERALILTPTGRDALLIESLLQPAVPTLICADMQHLCAAMNSGAGVAVMAEEVFNASTLDCLTQELARQPAWSELPLIVLTAAGHTSRGSTRLAESLEPIANVTHLERPVRRLTLASTVRAALRARRRQYQIRDLLAAKEQAIRDSEAAVRQRDEFLAMLGHELRNPLGTISSCLHVMDMLGWNEKIIAEQRPVLHRQTKHLGRLVDDLLDVARITNGSITLQKSAVDLADLVRRCVESMAQRFRDADVKLSATTSPERIMIDGDAVRLEQVLSNLLSNALKFTPAGGSVRVSASVEADDFAVISVRDSGIGIQPDLLNSIFDLFAQAHVSIDRQLGGLGLGLTIVRRLIELHGGAVAAHSDGPGRGTNIIVRLPLLTTSLPAARPQQRPRAQGTRRVLLVEDNSDMRSLMRRLLRLWGHEVEEAQDGLEAVDKVAALRPDVVVLDIGLPGLDGYEVARRLRSNGHKDLCLIAVTGYGQREDQERALDAGFNAHVVKPVDPDRLSQLILGCTPD